MRERSDRLESILVFSVCFSPKADVPADKLLDLGYWFEMDATLRKEAEKLRAMGSSQAATHLIENGRQSWRPTFVLIQHLTWKVADQMRLAEHFLPRKPFADAFPYEVFASFMSADNFLAAIDRVWPKEKPDRDLLEYHLGPILDDFAKTEKGKLAVESFLATRQQ